MDQRLDMLREAYVQDVIDIETFEQFTGLCLEGPCVALPAEVMRFRPAGPPTAMNFSTVLKQGWTATSLSP